MGKSQQAHRLGWIVLATLASLACEARATDSNIALLCSGTATTPASSDPPIPITNESIIINFGQRRVTSSILGEFPLVGNWEDKVDFEGTGKFGNKVMGEINRVSGAADIMVAGDDGMAIFDYKLTCKPARPLF